MSEYRLASHYFLPDPAALAFDHWPEDEQWQLVARPATLDAFERLPEVSSRAASVLLTKTFLVHSTRYLFITRDLSVHNLL